MPRTELSNKPIKIPEGQYLTLAQIAQCRNVYPQTVLYWVNQHWLPSIRLPGLGYIINERYLATFVPPSRGRRAAKG